MKQTNIRVVITGASSGIGAATAIAFARQGARLVLGARGKAGLEDIAWRCREAGGMVETKVVDVTDADAVVRFAAKAHETLGGIDLWFSDVGIGVVGKYHDVPLDDHRRVVETNLLSHMHDAHAVLPIFRRQGHGIWVNMISSGGYVAAPYAAAYSASKFAVRGFSMALRHELEGSTVGVSVVHPGGVATSIARNARIPAGAPPEEIERGRKVAERLLRLAPDEAGEIIARGIERRDARILVGSDARAVSILERLSPVNYWRYLKKATSR